MRAHKRRQLRKTFARLNNFTTTAYVTPTALNQIQTVTKDLRPPHVKRLANQVMAFALLSVILIQIVHLKPTLPILVFSKGFMTTANVIPALSSTQIVKISRKEIHVKGLDYTTTGAVTAAQSPIQIANLNRSPSPNKLTSVNCFRLTATAPVILPALALTLIAKLPHRRMIQMGIRRMALQQMGTVR